MERFGLIKVLVIAGVLWLAPVLAWVYFSNSTFMAGYGNGPSPAWSVLAIRVAA
jgi:hypothetical protein